MTPELKISGLDQKMMLVSFSFGRKLGYDVSLRAEAAIDHVRAGVLVQLAEKLHDTPTYMTVLWQDEELTPAFEITGVQRLTGQRELKLIFEGSYTKLKDYTPGPFTNRKRVLKASNLQKLLADNFSNIVYWENDIKTELSRLNLEFPDGKQINHIQDNISDFKMLGLIIGAFNKQAKPGNNIALSGSVTDQRYQLVWVQEKKYRELNYTDSRRIENFNPPAGPLNLSEQPVTGYATYNKGSSLFTLSHLLNWGNDLQQWANWKKQNFPQFFGDRYVVEAVDYFSQGGFDGLVWNTVLNVLPQNTLFEIAGDPYIPSTWTKIGAVKSRNSKSQWIEVELKDFEKGYEIADVRLTTAYSGKDQDGGFHLVPEVNSAVLLLKGSGWLDPVVYGGNVRSKETRVEAPFWHLDDVTKWEFNKLSWGLDQLSANAVNHFSFDAKQYKINSEDDVLIATKGVTIKVDNNNMQID